MPTRTRTRAQERAIRVKVERAGNQGRIDERTEHLRQMRLKDQGKPPF